MTTIKDALKAFEAKTGEVAVDSTKVLLYGQFPPIQKMDIALGGLKNCASLLDQFQDARIESCDELSLHHYWKKNIWPTIVLLTTKLCKSKW